MVKDWCPSDWWWRERLGCVLAIRCSCESLGAEELRASFRHLSTA
jgi:hypothetical protein